MHEAFVVTPILKKLPAGLYIETLAAFGDYFLVSTKSGNLLYYQLTPRSQSDAPKQVTGEYEVNLLSSNKSFSKKTITQIEVVPEFQMLLCLADSSVNVFILDDTYINFVTAVSRSKGAQLFAVNIRHKQEDNKLVPSLHLCVVIKKRLLFYYWNQEELKFLSLGQDMTLPDTPRTIDWCENSLFIGYKTEYRLLEFPSGISKDLFSTGGKQQEPLVTQIAGNRIAAGMDDQTVIIDSEGNPALKYLIKWSEVPLSLAYDSPYLIAVLPSSLEVRSIEPRLHVQSIRLKNIKMISSSKSGWVFVASYNELWLLHSVPFSEQIAKLREQNELALALCMAKMVSDDELQKNIQNLHAFALFRKRQFREAMDIFLELGTDPCHVIGLFPNLLPKEFRHQLEYPDKLPTLVGVELETGLLALASYLVQVRNKLVKVTDVVDGAATHSSFIAIEIGSNSVRSKNQLLQIIDTTLLKSYLLSNEALVSSLLRQKNYCHVEESERALKEHKKYNDLILLYNGKGNHDKALELMRSEAKKPDSPLKGHDRTVKYLQQLERKYLSLVFKYAEWVLRDYPEDGLKIFIDECIEKDHFPISEVYSYLQRTVPDLVIPFLEHVIHVWGEETAIYHNSLISKYRKKICSLREEYKIALPEGEPLAKPGEETQELQELHSKLIQFLENSQHYSVETFAMHLQHDGLSEAAAVVLGRLNRHKEALYIYTHTLKDMEKAEAYCSRHYNKDRSSDKDVYLLLVKMFLCTPDIQELCSPSSPTMYSLTPPQHNLELALKILAKYSSFVDPSEVIDILPSDVPVSKIRNFLKSVLQDFQTEKHRLKLIKSLITIENLHVRHQSICQQSFKLVVSDLDLCRVCQKRIGKGAFAYFPNGVYVHYSCKDHYINIGGKF